MRIKTIVPIVLGTILGFGVLGARAVLSAEQGEARGARRALSSAVLASGAAARATSHRAPAERDAPSSACKPHSTCAGTLRANEAAIDAHRQRLRSVAPSWRHHQELAALHLQHAELTGEHESYARAEDALARAFALAPRGTGPYLVRARLDLALRRFDRIEHDLQRLEAQPHATRHRLATEGIRAEVALHQGREREAARRFSALETRPPDVDNLVRLARWHTHRRDFARADASLARARDLVSRDAERVQASLELRRGDLDRARGHLDDALAHYQTAAVFFDGWHRIDERIAEVAAARRRRPTTSEELLLEAERGEEDEHAEDPGEPDQLVFDVGVVGAHEKDASHHP